MKYLDRIDNDYLKLPQSERDCIESFEITLPKYVHQFPSNNFFFEFGFLIDHGHIAAINIINKNLTHLPININNLTELKHLGFRFNEISHLPPSLGSLKKLETLDLMNNKIQNLPDTFSALDNLASLSLCSNNIHEFPLQILSLKNLKVLDLSQNQLEKIPDDIQKLQNLESLCLRSQPLSEIPSSLGNLHNLKDLFLDFTNITRLPNSFADLHFRQFNFNRYRMEYPPVAVVEQGFDAMRTFWRINQEQLQKLIQKLATHQEFTEDDLNWPYWKYHPIPYQQVCALILPRILHKITHNLPLNHFEMEYPSYAQYAHILEPLCYQHVNPTSKFILHLLKSEAQVTCAKKMKIYL